MDYTGYGMWGMGVGYPLLQDIDDTGIPDKLRYYRHLTCISWK
jgi:hypothetical protein